MAKTNFNTIVPAPVAHEFTIRDTMNSHNKELLIELRKTSIDLEKNGASREEIFNSLYELMTSSHWQAYSSEEGTANAIGFDPRKGSAPPYGAIEGFPFVIMMAAISCIAVLWT